MWKKNVITYIEFVSVSNDYMWIRSGTGSTQPHKDNWVAASLRSSGSD